MLKGSLRVGSLAGFELKVHWSTLVIFGLLVSSLAGVQLPDQAPGYGNGAYLAAAVLAGVAFYLALVAHEVSHAIVARREGVEVESLTLWMLGGMAALRGEPPTAGADLRIAAIGPAVSLAIAAVGAVAAALLDLAGAGRLTVAVVAWLAGINGLLGVFNLVPAAPLDGGRILRAALWAWRHDQTWANLKAARAGVAFGYVLVVVGILTLFSPGVGGLWFILIGWFLINVARAEESQAVTKSSLGDRLVGEVMTPDPVTVPADVSIAELLEHYVLTAHHNGFPVVDQHGDVVGLVTLGRVRRVPAEERANLRVGDVACPIDEVAISTPEDRLADLLPKLNACGDGRALVLRDGRLVGILTPTDVARIVEVAALEPSSSVATGRPEHTS
ncbi:MAG: Zn-dependent protease [Acidimicrobiales bacterium]|nr:Zn-dependent protease [Acidimicrobiales bacterium]